MSTTSSQTFYTANSILSNNSYHYSVTSVISYKSRKNVLYQRRMHPLPATMLPECFSIFSPDQEVLTLEVRYLCEELLPYLEPRLLPTGTVLLRSLGQENYLGSSLQYKNEEIRHCSELFIMLTREILLKGAIGVQELEGPCRILRLTFKNILFESGAFDTPATSNLNEIDFCASCAETQGPEKIAVSLCMILSVMDAFEAVLNAINPLAASDDALRKRRHQVSQDFSVIKDLTMDQYRELLAQKLVQAYSPQCQAKLEAKKNEVTFRISSRDGLRDVQESIIAARRPIDAKYDISEADEADAVQQEFEEVKWEFPQEISIIEEGSDGEGEWDIVDFDSLSCSIFMLDLMYEEKDEKPRRQGFRRRFFGRFSLLSWVFVKRKG